MKLFYIILGATVDGRHTEQHDAYFGVANSIEELGPELAEFWPEAGNKLHVDACMTVEQVMGFDVTLVPKGEATSSVKLYFINLGGYQRGYFGELHQQQIIAATDLQEAITIAKQSDFFKEKSLPNAGSHVDDRYAIAADVDDAVRVEDLLPQNIRENYSIQLSPALERKENPFFVGYLKVTKLLADLADRNK